MKSKFFPLIILCFITSLILTKDVINNKVCSVDNQCDPPYKICIDGNCKHKELWKPTILESIGIIIILVISVLASAVGIGGGPLYISILVFFFRFDSLEAQALSNGLIFLNSMITYCIIVFRKHPTIEHRSVIDYSLSIIMTPTMMVGSVLG